MKKKGDKAFKWNNKEIDVFLNLWAEQSEYVGWTDDAYRNLATQAGNGYRPRDPGIIQPKSWNLLQQARRYRPMAQERLKYLQESRANAIGPPSVISAFNEAVDSLVPPPEPSPPVETPAPAPAPTPAPSAAPEPHYLDFMLRIPEAAVRRIIREEILNALALDRQRVDVELRVDKDVAAGVLAAGNEAVVNALRQYADEQLAPEEPPRPKHNPQPFVTERPHTYQVVVCGGNPQQIESVQLAFPDMQIQGCMQGTPTAQNPDLVIIMTKFYGHSSEKKVQKMYDKAKIARVNGAADTVKAAITGRLGVVPKPRFL